jgi:dTDP-glucose 4,6-dehydratase
MIKNILEGKKLPLYGDGSNVRDWLYVEDHCQAIDIVLTKGNVGEVYNVGGHNEKQNIEIVRLMINTIYELITVNESYKKVLKTHTDNINYDLIYYVKDRLGHDKRYAIDPTKISKELGWQPETKFEEGIIKTIKWYLENQKWGEQEVSGKYQKYYSEMYNNR